MGVEGAYRPVRPGRPMRPRSRRGLWWTWLIPATALTAVFTVYPAIESVRTSAYDWAGYGPKTYVGGDNYRALWDDGVFHDALVNTVLFAVVTAVGTVVVGTAIALVLERRRPFSGLLKAVVFMPVVIPIVFTGLVWVYGLDTDLGWINTELAKLSPGLARGWLSDPSLVMATISVVTIFQFAGLPMIIVLAALEEISPEVREAATIDGAGPLRQARYISLPLARDVILTLLLLQLLYGFRVFDQVFVMTQGGPGLSSEVMSTYVYRQAFTLQHFGLGAAGAVVTCVLMVVVAMAYLTVFRTSRTARA
jgi:raffinose/stachyose/melibiose transport system permease protein